MNPAVTRFDRFMLVVLGLLLVAAGVLGLARSFDAFGSSRAVQPVLDDEVAGLPDRHDWFWWAVAAAAVLVALLALWWLLEQLRTDHVSRLDLSDDDTEGTTVVHAGAVTGAVEDEVETFLGVQRASARMMGKAQPRLELTVNLEDTADLAQIRERLVRQTVPHARQALDNPDLRVEIELRPGVSDRRTPLR